jgi:hypothetical protein
MYKRVAIVVCTAVLLIAGMLSSAVCEMTCLPQAQNKACCARQMQQTMHRGHCGHAGAASVVNGHQCEHPQDNPATFTAEASVIQLHGISIAIAMVPAPGARASIAGRHDLPIDTVLQRSSITPLRI